MTGRGVRAALTVCALAACSCDEREDASASASQDTRTARAAIVGGGPSDAVDDAVVLLLYVDPANPDRTEQCTGTLLAPRLVLTARHCVAITEAAATCNDEGKSDFGGKVLGSYAATDLFVLAGRERTTEALKQAVRGKELLTTGAPIICDHDIALLLLAGDLEAPIAPVRLGPPSADETVRLVGWGLTSDSLLPATRQTRAEVDVVTVGPASRLGPKEFRVGEGACSGDSGGPALASSTGAVLGVLSRGGNGRPADADAGAAAACLDAESVYTQVGAHAELLREGYAKAGQSPWLEGEPDPRPRASATEAQRGCGAARRNVFAFDAILGLGAVALASLRRRVRSSVRRGGDAHRR